jgi:hypothetical protein
MKSVLKISLFLLAALPLENLKAAGIESLQAELARLELRRDSCLQRQDSLERLVIFQAQEVAKLKQGLDAGELSPVDQYRLETSLRTSQVLADSLDALSLTISDLESRIAELSRTGDNLCAAAADSLSLLLDKTRSVEEVRDILRKIGEYRLLRASFASEARDVYQARARTLGVQATALEIEAGDSPEDIREKADFLSDMADKWERHLVLINTRIERLEDERSIRQRIGEFAQEISLFDHGAASSRAQVKSSGTGPQEEGHTPPGVEDFFPGETRPPSVSEATETPVAKDLELYDLEKSLALSEAIESLSYIDLEDLLRILQSRQDSLKTDLDSLRAWGRRLREEAEKIER